MRWLLTKMANALGSQYREGIKASTFFGVFTVYWVANPDVILRAHELWHQAQARRLGVVRFTWLWLWYLWKYGYWNSPLESSARVAAEKIAGLMDGMGVDLDIALDVYSHYANPENS
jgi:hypothetical protein